MPRSSPTEEPRSRNQRSPTRSRSMPRRQRSGRAMGEASHLKLRLPNPRRLRLPNPRSRLRHRTGPRQRSLRPRVRPQRRMWVRQHRAKVPTQKLTNPQRRPTQGSPISPTPIPTPTPIPPPKERPRTPTPIPTPTPPTPIPPTRGQRLRKTGHRQRPPSAGLTIPRQIRRRLLKTLMTPRHRPQRRPRMNHRSGTAARRSRGARKIDPERMRVETLRPPKIGQKRQQWPLR